MRPFGVVPFDPASNGGTGFAEAGEVMLPDTLFFEAAKKAFDETVLLGCIRRNEFLAQTIIAAGGTKTPALKDQSIIRAHHRRWAGRAQRPEARQAGLLERAFGFLGAATQGEFKAIYFAVVAINHCGQMTPTISSARHVSDVHGPAFIAPLRTAPTALDARPWRRHTLMDEPTFDF